MYLYLTKQGIHIPHTSNLLLWSTITKQEYCISSKFGLACCFTVLRKNYVNYFRIIAYCDVELQLVKVRELDVCLAAL